ncbi:hypothetical protein KIPE111705_05340 [Kibdelosporangium persicum]
MRVRVTDMLLRLAFTSVIVAPAALLAVSTVRHATREVAKAISHLQLSADG